MTGIAIGTLFTLFVVPAMYLLLTTDRSRQRAAEGKPDKASAPPG
jgi:multidrug efflux pump